LRNGGWRWQRPFPLFLLVAVGLQYLGGASHAELSGRPDESAHFVTGRMVADYLSTFPHTPMLQFAKYSYIHRPKIAIGHYPPLFYFIQGLWFLLFGASRQSAFGDFIIRGPRSDLLRFTIFAILAVFPRTTGCIWPSCC